MSNTDKLREIAHKYGGAIITGYGQSSASGSTEMFTAEEQCLSDLTALISEHYVAKEEVDKMVEEMRQKLFSMRATKKAMDELESDDKMMQYGYHDCINEMLMWTKSREK